MPLVVSPKQIWRRLAAAPAFSAIAVVTIALGVGANTTVFGVVDSILLKPLPYPHPQNLLSVLLTAPGMHIDELELSPSTYFVFREQNHSFEDIGLWANDSVSITGRAEPEQVDAIDVTDGVLPLLGAQPMQGRTFRRADDQPGAPDTVLLTYGYWQHKYGGHESAIGSRLLVNGKPHDVIGVLPKEFRFLDKNVSVVLPLTFDRAKVTLGDYSYRGIARLRAGVTPEQAAADMNRMLAVVYRSFRAPEGYSVKQFEDAHTVPKLAPLAHEVTGDSGTKLWVVMGTIGLVLLIACANVANLLLVRAEGRQQELAVRAALGASSKQIAVDILSESVALGVCGGAVGLGAAFAAIRVLIATAPQNLPRLHEISINATTVLFCLAVSICAGLLFGAVPAWKYARMQSSPGMRQGSRNSSMSRERHQMRNALVVLQVTLAVMLLISSGLMMRTAQALAHVNPGIADPGRVETLQIAIPEPLMPKAEAVMRTQEAMIRALQSVPGVTAASLSRFVPMDGDGTFDPVFARDKAYSEQDIPVQRFEFIAPGYLKTVGARITAGRDYEWSDLYERHMVTMVSENLAKAYWGTAANAIGKQVRSNRQEQWREVIGVVADIHSSGVNTAPPAMAYWPVLMSGFEGDKEHVERMAHLVVRSDRAGSEAFAGELRRAIWSVNAAVPIANVDTLGTLLKRSMAWTSFTLVMLAVAAGMALLLGVIGIYGVIAYSVTQRRREVGVRLAIGAQPAQLLRMFMQSGLSLTVTGAVLGMAGSAAAMQLMSGLLFGVQPVDGLTYATACIALLAAATVATYIPSRRAMQIDPAEALRFE